MSEMTKRTELYRALPLDTPYSVHIFSSYHCNFRCRYCLHSLSEETLAAKGFRRQMMEYGTFEKTIEDIKKFPRRLKAMIFAGHGEPLTHPDIARMAAYAKEKDIAERVEIVTNGSLLTPELSDALIEAGIDRLRVSVQGTDEAAYEKIAGRGIDFDVFVGGLRYFYEHKRHTEVYVKIIDVALKDEEDAEKFREIFAPISDEAAIEYEIPFVREVDNSALKEKFDRSKQGGDVLDASICSMPFYMLVVTPSGDVVPCCSTDAPIVLGNVLEQPLTRIWQGAMHAGFCRLHLLGNRSRHPVCSVCSVPRYGLQQGDYLDGHEAELLPHYAVKWDTGA